MAIGRENDIERIPQGQKMDLSDCYLEEDLFPKIFADYEERSYGILFYCSSGWTRSTLSASVIASSRVSP